jgi:Serine carboxypeptidase S28
VTKTTVHLDAKIIDNSTTANDDDNDVESSERNNVMEWAKSLGFCLDTVPSYIQSRDVLAEELLMLVVTSNADFNMDYYPPTNDTDLVKTCRIFADTNTPHLDRYRNFLQFKRELLSEQDDDNAPSPSQQQESPTCFAWDSELPLGPNATLSTADWSGAGDGTTAQSWEFQICRDLVVQTGWGSKSMFVPSRQWSLQWLSDHCWSRFHIRPLPGRMQNLWHFDASSLINRTSHILFTNGLQDGWSVSSYQTNLSKTILALNFPNGAHHSDLSHEWPVPGETEDLIKGHESILNIVRQWLYEISKERGF